MVDGWRSDNIVGQTDRVLGSNPADPYDIRVRFPTPDHTDGWPKPSAGDNLNQNSGRYPDESGNQFNVDGYQLERRQRRLALLEGLAERKKERVKVVQNAFDAMLESCVNEGQRVIISKYRQEFMAMYTPNGFPEVNEFLEFWKSKVELSVN